VQISAAEEGKNFMKLIYKKLIETLGQDRVQLNEPLSRHTYYKIGGPADLFFTAHNLVDLKRSIQVSSKLSVPYFIVGGGSNILAGDKGFRGLVIKNRADKITIHKLTGKIKNEKIAINKAQVTAESGVITNLLVRRTIQEGLSGLEYFLGVPGTIGGAIYNNSHYKDQLIGNFVDKVKVLDKKGHELVYTKNQMQFAYNYSILQKTKEVILSVTFLLKGSDANKLWKKAEGFAKKRSETQPLNFPSAGSTFKNPQKNLLEIGADKPIRPTSGYLIDKAGLKGTKVGGAMISKKHANFIVNTGGATAKDVCELIEIVKEKVKDKFNIDLEMEVFKVGEF
jgi:UDP-N-acetylmuramate dehydrogenase